MASAVPEPSSSRLVAVADGVDRVVGVICRTIVLVPVVVLLAIIGANVVVRYAVGHGGITWISEVPEQLFPWLIAAGIALAAINHGAHIAVEILRDSLRRDRQRWLIVAINLLVALAYLVVLRVLLQVAEITAIERSPILQLPRSLGYYAL
jgi:TRAP-type C4-dicarboxylate transport system permease small subunit